MPVRFDLCHGRVNAAAIGDEVADLEILQLRVDACRRVLSFDVPGVEHRPLDAVVGVEPRPIDAHLDDPRPHPLRRRVDGDGTRALNPRVRHEIITRQRLDGFITLGTPTEHRRTPGKIRRNSDGNCAAQYQRLRAVNHPAHLCVYPK
ncbi:MAG TPA: hypothetical protein VFR23_23235 [Jiangellaceae bacterium]|nr:hypothetical protein [Jiangellaceae bacterium]